MDPADVWNLIEGEADILGPAHEQERETFRQARCPACMEVGAEKRIAAPQVELDQDGMPEVVRSAFSPDYPLARGHAHCLHCGTDYDLQTGLILHDNLSMIRAPHSDPHQE